MVNGPRPSSIAKPASVAALSTPSARTQSPMILQRQATSLYSTCSTSTLVFANIRPTNLTDLLEQGADAEVELEQEETDDHTVQETASVAETTAFSEKLQAPALNTTQNTLPAASQSTTAHVAFIYRYDPYSPQRSKRELYRCECDDCLEGLTCGLDNLTVGSYSYTAQPHVSSGMEPVNSDEYRAASYEYDDAVSTAQTATSYRGQQQYPAYWSSTQDAPAVDSVPPPSVFVPPPPPPKITRGVMAESAEPSLDVDAAFYHIALRWYNKTAAVESRFVRNGDLCPAPQREGETFTQWIDAVGKWWLRHFEHAQTKTSASSGMLRTATAPASAKLTGTGGFETHASIADSFAAHKRALRSFPHREVGISGLTEEILRTHEQKHATKSPRARHLPW